MDHSDREYIRRCTNGQPDEFRHLVRRYQPVVLARLNGSWGHRLSVDDVAQEAFVRAFFALKKLRRPELFCHWLLGIADRVAKEQYRKEARLRNTAQESMVLMPEPASSENHALEGAIDELPGPYREAILLRYYAGLPCKAVAERLGRPLGTVTKMLSRAHAMLGQALRTKEMHQ